MLQRRGILLNHLIQLLDGVIDLRRAHILLFGRRRDFLHESRRFLDIRHEFRQHFPGMFGGRHAGMHQLRDFGCRVLAALREGADFGGDDGKAFAVILRPRRLNRRVQRQHSSLARNILNNRHFFGDLLHRRDGLGDGLPCLFGALRGEFGDPLGFGGVFRALPDVRRHFFHRRRRFFRRRRLRGRALRHLRRAEAHLLAAGRDRIRGLPGLSDNGFHLLHHLRERFGELADFILLADVDRLRQIAVANRVSSLQKQAKRARQQDADRERQADQQQQI